MKEISPEDVSQATSQVLLPSSFYLKPTTSVAKALLGKKLVRLVDGRRLSGMIVETEAYLGVKDAAAHSFGDRNTQRIQAMYLNGGHAYVYRIYGLHWCFNAVTQKSGIPEAVLIRALEPLEGISIMKKNRNVSNPVQLTSGPAKLCAALGIDKSLNSYDLTDPYSEIFIEDGTAVKPSQILKGPRIGVDYAGEAAQWLLRFGVRGSPYLSRKF